MHHGSVLPALGSSSHDVSEDLLRWAAEQLGPSGAEPPVPTAVVTGWQARVAFLTGAETEAVLKVLVDPERDGDLRAEYAALTALHGALGVHDEVACPRPLALHPGGQAYLMTKVAGRPLDQVELAERDLDATIDRVLHGLSAYYRAVGDIYGDFQPSNVLVAVDSTALIDPTLPASIHREIAATLTHAPASADLAYWTYSVVSRAAQASVAERGPGARRLLATEVLLRKAPGFFGVDENSFLTEVERATTMRLERLRRNTPVKGVLLERFGKQALKRLLERASSR